MFWDGVSIQILFLHFEKNPKHSPDVKIFFVISYNKKQETKHLYLRTFSRKN